MISRPLISFTLFFACYSSPTLTTLWEPSAVSLELRRAACTYLLTHARVDRCVPALLFPSSPWTANPRHFISPKSSNGTGATLGRARRRCWRLSSISSARTVGSIRISWRISINRNRKSLILPLIGDLLSSSSVLLFLLCYSSCHIIKTLVISPSARWTLRSLFTILIILPPLTRRETA